ncbi:transcriptional regulator, MerR family [Stanieria cyanosphaera PCC 7437]|uniref:Transcriptional regulator, MerR family n=1 Tax=Stanieria cyanosphaera (strain ATCC 29371 / PCC 7437) TaxID=111780 RepID=K9XWR3_STAC7|nr:heavy metal-responsive transcriptional regulator [Stanieria cyanosphaera]AFZ36519.1 transcriptional regulator, MerR family [Stanieria cyanosphaera PCC 7437]
MSNLTQEAVELLKIGELQNRTGVSIKTIRYYEQLGLIKAVTRTEGGFRLFNVETIHRLALIKRAQSLGLSLQEISDILTIRDRGSLPCDQVKQQLQNKVNQIEQRIQELQLLKAQLISLIKNTENLPHEVTEGVICPIIEQF